MTIVYCIDKNCKDMCRMSIDTLLKHNNTCNIFVLFTDPNIDNALFNNVSLINISKYIPSNFHFDALQRTTNLTQASYYRLFIPYVFNNLDKIIYLDADTLITGNIDELWNIDPDYIAACKDHTDKLINNLFIPNAVNAGVLNMNLKSLREMHIIKIANKITSSLFPDEFAWWHDQSVLNYLFQNKINLIHPKFNFFIRTWTKEPYIQKPNFEPKILHIIGKGKWNNPNMKNMYINTYNNIMKNKAIFPIEI